VRHGTETGSVTLGSRRVAVRRPRVRTIADDDQWAREVPLESYTTLAATDLLAESIVARMLAGISTRRYPIALQPRRLGCRRGGVVDVEVGRVTAVRQRDGRPTLHHGRPPRSPRTVLNTVGDGGALLARFDGFGVIYGWRTSH
jgi:hypothetical protein